MGVESFLEVQKKSVNLPTFIQNFSPVVYNCDQLNFTTVPFPEFMFLSNKSACSSKCAIKLEQTMCFVTCLVHKLEK